MPLWRYTTGQKGLNRVTVYERRGTKSLYIEWWDDEGRHQVSLKAIVGHPVSDRALAKRLADKGSRDQERRRNLQASESVFGVTEHHTVKDVLDRLHELRQGEWSRQYKSDQGRYKRFWLDQLGADTRLARVSEAWVEDVARKATSAKGWSGSTHRALLRYIVDAYYFAHRKLKWIEERHTLSGVDFPRARTVSRAYSENELWLLLAELGASGDPRAWAVAEIAYATGRRLNAIRSLGTEAYKLKGEIPTLQFPDHTDKARNAGLAVLTTQAQEAVEALLFLPAVQSTGLLFPRGDLSKQGKDTRPIRREDLLAMLRASEKAAGVEHVHDRGYHGIKRRFATITQKLIGSASKQSGTTEEMLRRGYVQDDLGPKVELANALEERRGT